MSTFDILVLIPLAAWVIVAALSCYGVSEFVKYIDQAPQVTWRPRIALIIPVRGVPPEFDALWQAICVQTLSPHRIIFAVENETDGAYAAIEELPHGQPRECVIAGPTSTNSQKVHNLLAAFGTLAPEDEVIVTADADIVPDQHWLARLVLPLKEPQNTVVSGYRWMTPVDERWSSAMVCVANASVATLPRLPSWNLAWGGSAAMRRETFDALDLPNYWNTTVSDDISLSQAVGAHGWSVTSQEGLLIRTPIAWNWSAAFAFGRRQYLLLRLCAPRFWVLSAAGTTTPLIGWAVALPLAISGSIFAIATILVAIVLDQLRASLRRRVPRILWNEEMPRRMALIDRFGTPASLFFHAAIIWSTLFGDTISWAGRTYRVRRAGRIENIDVHTA